MKNKIITINNILIEYFGIPNRNKKNPNPVDMLIGTILSQNTNDKNSYRAYQNLKAKYKNWEEVAELPLIKISKEIKIAGLAKQKSKSIKNIFTGLKKKGEISLKYLEKLDDITVLNELTKFEGVGVKTVACVLLFSMNRNVCPVDTHVHRTLNRIGLVNTKSPDKTFNELVGNIPEGIAHSFHTNLIRLGREICKSLKPYCTGCPLLKNCKFKHKSFEIKGTYKKNEFMLLDNIN